MYLGVYRLYDIRSLVWGQVFVSVAAECAVRGCCLFGPRRLFGLAGRHNPGASRIKAPGENGGW